MKAALLQMTSGIDPAANATILADAIAEAAAQGAAIMFTPEMTGLIDRDRARAAAAIRDESDDPVLRAARKAAAEHGIWVHLGSLALRGADGKWVNRGFMIDDQGVIQARYDKLHLFDVDLPTGESWRESAAYSAGATASVVATPIGVIGMAICYDLRFADLFRALSDAGAMILTAPAAFTRPTGEAHWHILLRARAIEAGSYMIAAAQTGEHEDGRATFGHSLVIDPWGEIILDMGVEPGIGFAEIDLARVADVRARIPVLHHRRAIPAVEVIG